MDTAAAQQTYKQITIAIILSASDIVQQHIKLTATQGRGTDLPSTRRSSARGWS